MNKYKQFSKVKENIKHAYKMLHQKRQIKCITKKRFITKNKAGNFLKENNYNGRAYFCDRCNYWHNTSKTNINI